MYTYTYDVVGNRQIQGISGTVTTYDYDAINRMISSTVSGQSAVGYTWDDNGNLLNTGVSTNTFDVANRLIESQRSGQTVKPIYDGVGNRVAQVTNGVTTTFALDVMGLPEVIYTSDDTKYLHLPGLIMTENTTGTQRFLLSDNSGSARQVVDEDNEVIMVPDFRNWDTPGESRVYSPVPPRTFPNFGTHRHFPSIFTCIPDYGILDIDIKI